MVFGLTGWSSGSQDGLRARTQAGLGNASPSVAGFSSSSAAGFGWDGGGSDDYSVDDLPTFEYRTDELGVRLDSRIVDILLLVLFAVAFFMAAFVSFLRSDVS